MKIVVYSSEKIALESHRQQREQVEVDINDTIDTVKLKVTLVYTSLNPDSFHLELDGSYGNRCLPSETILAIKNRVKKDELHFRIVHDTSCCSVI